MNTMKYIIYHLLIWQEYSEMFWNMSIKITNTVKDHYSTEVLQQQQQQQQQLTLLRNRYSQFDIYNFNSTYPKMLRLF